MVELNSIDLEEQPPVEVNKPPKLKKAKKGSKVAPSAALQSVFLHVLGDALGSIAVIISALIIWLTDYEWRFYVDPIVRYKASSLRLELW